jgi:hypothetical protein
MVTMGLKCLSANCRVVCDNSIGVLLYAGSLFLTLSCGAGFIRTSVTRCFSSWQSSPAKFVSPARCKWWPGF